MLPFDSPKVRGVHREIELSRNSTLLTPVCKIVLLIIISVIICVLAILSPNDVLRSKRQFKEWYPQFKIAFNQSARNVCTKEYQIYLYGTRENITVENTTGGGNITVFVQPMINCMLSNSSEYIKYALGSSQVMLGLTPTILALLGAGSEEVCLLGLIGRRRFLAIFLAAASPSIYTSRAFEYRNPGEIISSRLDLKHVNTSLHPWYRRCIIIIEYIFLGFALANIAELSYELGIRSVNGVNPNTIFMPMLWSILAIPAHLGGAVVFNLKARRVDSPDEPPPQPVDRSRILTIPLAEHWGAIKKFWTDLGSNSRRWVSWFWNSIRRELYFHPEQGPSNMIFVQSFKETKLFIALAWLLSVLIIFHIILGTLILSSTSFIGPRDALGVMARYIVSVVICRVIVVYELAVVRVQYKNGLDAQRRESVKGNGLGFDRVQVKEQPAEEIEFC